MLFNELRRLGASNPIISTNHPTGSHGMPIDSGKRLDDEGVAVYFTLNKRQMTMACDRFNNATANMRSLGMAIDAMRQLERHGGGTMIERAFDGFILLAAPEQPHQILGVRPDATMQEIEAAYREKAKSAQHVRVIADTVLRTESLAGQTFDYEDLNAVMDAVRAWCRDRMLSHQISCAPGGSYVVHTLRRGATDLHVVAAAIQDDLCHALLEACVEANRKLNP